MMSLAWPLFRVTEQAALAAWPQTGCGDKNKIDGLAVTAMRQALNDVAFRGRVVIGEGEIDHAPMLWIGEEVGKGDGPEVDIAVDPIEGTRMVAMGQSNALAVMAFAPRDSLLHAPDMYMKKLVVNRLAAGAIDLSLPLADNLRNVARALGKPLDKLRMVTLDKPRLSAAIEEATQLGVKVFALPDGDVAAIRLKDPAQAVVWNLRVGQKDVSGAKLAGLAIIGAVDLKEAREQVWANQDMTVVR